MGEALRWWWCLILPLAGRVFRLLHGGRYSGAQLLGKCLAIELVAARLEVESGERVRKANKPLEASGLFGTGVMTGYRREPYCIATSMAFHQRSCSSLTEAVCSVAPSLKIR